MEEVDNIIIESLKNIRCDIPEDIKYLKDFTPDVVVDCIVSCLETITPGINFSHKLSPLMSLRLKLATNIAEHIKSIGFRGDMGYQSILYCNEIEIRRVLMFLIERLPRDNRKVSSKDDTNHVLKLANEIKNKIRSSLENVWIPSAFLQAGVREYHNSILLQSTKFSVPLKSNHLEIPATNQPYPEAFQQYWALYLPDINAQCSPETLLASVLFKDNEFNSFNNISLQNVIQPSSKWEQKIEYKDTVAQLLEVKEPITAASVNEHYSNQVEDMTSVVNSVKTLVDSIQDSVNILKAQLNQMVLTKMKDEALLNDTISKIKVKSKSLAVLSKTENLVKLKSLIQNGNERLINLTNQWNEVQTPLLEQYQMLMENSNFQEQKIQGTQNKLQNVRTKINQITKELQEKENIEQRLLHELENFNQNTNRAAHTKRILEIIENIKKQNVEIQKILKDTNQIQKDINTLNGQVDRSFTLSDELIFRDAKHDEIARKAYKLLVSLHTECAAVVEAVTNLGLAERESRTLQDQVDAEAAREIDTKLARVNADLMQIEKDMATLVQQK